MTFAPRTPKAQQPSPRTPPLAPPPAPGRPSRYSKPALRAVAAAAQKKGTGTRGLRCIMENLLVNSMFEVRGRALLRMLCVCACAPLQRRAGERSLPAPRGVIPSASH